MKRLLGDSFWIFFVFLLLFKTLTLESNLTLNLNEFSIFFLFSSALNVALERADLTTVQLLFKFASDNESKAAALTHKDKDGYNPLHLACLDQSAEAIRLLLEVHSIFLFFFSLVWI